MKSVVDGVKVFLSWSQASVASVDESSVIFDKITPTSCGPERLSPGWVDKSRLSCAARCKTGYPTRCLSFMYNKLTKLCTLGGDLNSINLPATPREGDLYYQTNPPFKVVISANSTVNVAYFIGLFNYTEAEAACRRLNAHLFVPDTNDKWRLLSVIMTPPYFTWIGLDDRADEDIFVWANSSRAIDLILRESIFEDFQPDNGYGSNQDCVAVRQYPLKLDDIECWRRMGCICQRPTC